MTAPISHTPGIVERLRDWPAGGQDMLSSTVVGNLTTEAADTIDGLLEALHKIERRTQKHPDDTLVDSARNNRFAHTIARIAIASATGIPS